MCMVYDDDGRILVQNRVGSWSGIAFPGGHIEPNESFTEAVIREVKEETGLTVRDVQLCGIKQGRAKHADRMIVLLYKTNSFTGELRSSREGKVFWIKPEELNNYRLASGFDALYQVFANDDIQEFQWIEKDGEWIAKLF